MSTSFLDYLNQLIWSAYKYMLHQWTGQCEIERIILPKSTHTKREKDHLHVSLNVKLDFTKSLKVSKQLSTYSKIIFYLKPFSVEVVKRFIIQRKELDSPDIASGSNGRNYMLHKGITQCLRSLRLVNCVYEHLEQERIKIFSYEKQENVDFLEELWTVYFPQKQRSGNRLSEEWTTLGFQGKDPATDFRGMGMLGLEQLIYFGKMYPTAARELLSQSQREDQGFVYFPFAATGINITAFILELFKETRCHKYIMNLEDDIMLSGGYRQSSSSSSLSIPEDDELALDESKECIATAVKLVHDLYCEVFVQLGQLWRNSRPRDIMDFPKVFAQLKVSVRSKYAPVVDLNVN